MAAPPEDIELLHASIDAGVESHLRLLICGKHIKYLTIAAGTYEADDMGFAPTLRSILPPLPPGDWNDGYIARHPTSGDPHFKTAVKTHFPGVQNAWHPTSFDYLDLEIDEEFRSNVCQAKLPPSSASESKSVVIKFARFSWEIGYLDDECAAYKLLQGTSIGPKFLGNITEDGRVVGFVLEHIKGARHAGPDDHAACEEALSKMHHVGLLHGDINRHNFLMVGGEAVLIDFDHTRKTTDDEALRREMDELKTQLADTSGRGGIIPESELEAWLSRARGTEDTDT